MGDRTEGFCKCHAVSLKIGGTIITASPNSFTNGLGTARMGDVVLSDCGHRGVIITASPNVFANGMGVARVGDMTDGCYKAVIITGSPNTYANG